MNDLDALEEVLEPFQRQYARDGRTQHCLKHPISRRKRSHIKSIMCGVKSHAKRRGHAPKPTLAKIVANCDSDA